MFMTNRRRDEVADASSTSQQFRDEYERQTTAQVGDDQPRRQGMQLGARNVSHRVSPALLPDGTSSTPSGGTWAWSTTATCA